MHGGGGRGAMMVGREASIPSCSLALGTVALIISGNYPYSPVVVACLSVNMSVFP
jgi:hypothetical protein